MHSCADTEFCKTSIMISTRSISTSVADLSDDFDCWISLPPPPLNKNDALNEALMTQSELVQRRLEQIYSVAQAKVNSELAKMNSVDNYVEKYIRPAVFIVRERTTSSGFIPDDYELYERKFGSDDSTTRSCKRTSRWWSKYLCVNTNVRM